MSKKDMWRHDKTGRLTEHPDSIGHYKDTFTKVHVLSDTELNELIKAEVQKAREVVQEEIAVVLEELATQVALAPYKSAEDENNEEIRRKRYEKVALISNLAGTVRLSHREKIMLYNPDKK